MSLDKINAPTTAAESAARQVDPKKQAKEKAELKKACQEFEGMFIAQMWKEMRKTVQKGGLVGGGFGEEIFGSMLDQAYSEKASQRGALGLADLLEQQLSPESYARPGGNLPSANVSQDAVKNYQNAYKTLGAAISAPAKTESRLSVTS